MPDLAEIGIEIMLAGIVAPLLLFHIPRLLIFLVLLNSDRVYVDAGRPQEPRWAGLLLGPFALLFLDVPLSQKGLRRRRQSVVSVGVSISCAILVWTIAAVSR